MNINLSPQAQQNYIQLKQMGVNADALVSQYLCNVLPMEEGLQISGAYPIPDYNYYPPVGSIGKNYHPKYP